MEILGPPWFLGYDIALELLFALVAGMVAWSAHKAYRMTGHEYVWLMRLAFFFISGAYLLQASFNIYGLYLGVRWFDTVDMIPMVFYFVIVGYYGYILLYLLGLTVLLYLTFKIKNLAVLWFLLVLSVVALVMSRETLATFFLLSTMYLIFLNWFFISNYLSRPNRKTATVAYGFMFLLGSSLLLLFSVGVPFLYALGHMFAFAGYILILLNLWLVHHHEQKTR